MKLFQEGQVVRLARFRSRSGIPTSNVDALVLKVSAWDGWRYYKLKYNNEKGALLEAWHREDVVSERISTSTSSIRDPKKAKIRIAEQRIEAAMKRFRKLLTEEEEVIA